MILSDENLINDPKNLSRLQQKRSFLFNDPFTAAKIIHEIEHKCINLYSNIQMFYLKKLIISCLLLFNLFY